MILISNELKGLNVALGELTSLEPGKEKKLRQGLAKIEESFNNVFLQAISSLSKDKVNIELSIQDLKRKNPTSPVIADIEERYVDLKKVYNSLAALARKPDESGRATPGSFSPPSVHKSLARCARLGENFGQLESQIAKLRNCVEKSEEKAEEKSDPKHGPGVKEEHKHGP